MVFGILLIVLGLGGFFGTGAEHGTALIPAYFGTALLILGLLALKDSLRKHAMHVAAMVGLLGVVGALFRRSRAAAGRAGTPSAPPRRAGPGWASAGRGPRPGPSQPSGRGRGRRRYGGAAAAVCAGPPVTARRAPRRSRCNRPPADRAW